MKETLIKEIEEKLREFKNLKIEKKEDLLYSLIDIEESLKKIYENILPNLATKDLSEEKFQDLLWDIREEFRHIDYHLHDSGLLDL